MGETHLTYKKIRLRASLRLNEGRDQRNFNPNRDRAAASEAGETLSMASLLDSLKNLFKPRPGKVVGDALYAACVTQARLPRFYIDYGIEDAIGARFELLTLHVILVVTRLKSVKTEQASEIAQALFDAFLLALDTTLREQGTGDLTVPKKMKTIGTVVYTRLRRWDDLWQAPAGADSAEYIARTLYAVGHEDESEAVVTPRVRALADYVETARQALRVEDLLVGRLTWPEPVSLVAEA